MSAVELSNFERPDIDGFQVYTLLGEGSYSYVYLGNYKGRQLALKVLKKDAAAEDKLRQLRKECTTLARLNHPNIIKAFNVGTSNGYDYMAMEYASGETLGDRIRAKEVSIKQTVRYAAQLAQALTNMRYRDIIHRDLKPENIIITDNDMTKIIDFDLSLDHKNIEEDAGFVGSLIYASPEACKIINREVDHRSDLYSLGCVIYECLTGQAPFKSPNAGRLLQMIGSIVPPPPSELSPDSIDVLDKIVMKLLKKDPDERYQSANELLDDLEAVWRKIDQGDLLVDHKHTIAPNELLLIGRDAELDKLNQALKKLEKKKGNISLITGYPGMGKTQIVKKFCNDLGVQYPVLKAKCDINKNAPFIVPIELLGSLVSLKREMHEREFSRLLEKFRKAMKGAEKLIVGINPKFDEIIGITGVEPENRPTLEARSNAITAMFSRLAKMCPGLVITIDDIQWLDEASHEFFHNLASDAQRSNIMIICTARTDPNSIYELELVVEKLAEKLTQTIEISYFDAASTKTMIQSFLTAGSLSTSLISFVHVNSKGLPFAISEYLNIVRDQGLLRYSWGNWDLDERGCNEIEIPNDIVSLLLWKVQDLSIHAIEIMKCAAIRGKTFNIKIMAAAVRQEIEFAIPYVVECIRLQLIEHIHGDMYRFTHDRVQESFIELTTQKERENLHRDIALELITINDDSPAVVYAIANHFMKTDVSFSPEICFRRIYQAGETALNSAAPEIASKFLEYARTIENDFDLQPNHQLLYLLALAYQRQEDIDRTCTIVKEALSKSDDPLLRANLYKTAMFNALTHMDLSTLWKAFKKGLKETGMSYFDNRFLLFLSVLYHWFVGSIIGLFGYALTEFSEEKRKLLRARAEFLDLGTIAAQYNCSFIDQVFISLLLKHSSLRLREKLNLITYNNHIGIILAQFGFGKLAKKRLEKNRQLAQESGEPRLEAKVHLFEAQLYLVLGDVQEAESHYRYELKPRFKWLEPVEHISHSINIGLSLLFRGKVKTMLDLFQGWSSKQVQDGFESTVVISALEAVPTILSGDAVTGMPFIQENKDCVNCKKLKYIDILMTSMRILTYVELEEHELVEKLVNEALDEIELKKIDTVLPLSYLYLSIGYGLIHLVERTRDSGDHSYKNKLKHLILKMEGFKNNPFFDAHNNIFKSWLALWEGRDCEQHLTVAIRLAENNDIPKIAIEAKKVQAEVFGKKQNKYLSKKVAALGFFSANQERYQTQANLIRRRFNLGEVKQNTDSTTGYSTGRTIGESKVALSVSSLKMKAHLEALINIGRASIRAIDLREQYRIALEEILRVINAERGIVFTFNSKGKIFPDIAISSAYEEIAAEGTYTKSIINEVIEKKRSIIFTGNKENDVDTSRSIVNLKLKSIIATPMISDDKVIGVIYLDNSLAKGVFTNSELELIEAITAQLSTSIDAAKSTALKIEKQEIAKSIELSHLVDHMLLPKKREFVSQFYGVSIHHETAPHIGSDWFQYQRFEDQSLVVFLADPVEKGAGAALLTSIFTGIYHSSNVLQSFQNSEQEVRHFLLDANDKIAKICHEKYLLTMNILWVDPKSGRYKYFNMAAPPILIAEASQATKLLFGEGEKTTPLGCGDFSYRMSEGSFSAGCRAILFSDGFCEVKNTSGSRLGAHGLRKIFEKTLGLDRKAALDEIEFMVNEKKKSSGIEDDQTMILVDGLTTEEV